MCIPFEVGSAAEFGRTERPFIHAGAVTPRPALAQLANQLLSAHLALFDTRTRLYVPIFCQQALHLGDRTVNCGIDTAARRRLKHLRIIAIGLDARVFLGEGLRHFILLNRVDGVATRTPLQFSDVFTEFF